MRRNLIAILRGVETHEVVDIASALILAGITRIEVPMNSPDPLGSIRAMATELDGQGEFGAGTVLSTKEVGTVEAAGGSFIVSPNCDTQVIRASKTLGMGSYPGVFSPTECFASLKAGADALKIFPASMMGLDGLKAVRAVLPREALVFAVGGVSDKDFGDWAAAGAQGFGLGSSLYKPGLTAAEVGQRAVAAVAAYDAVYHKTMTA